jgi:ABC-type lipoprotein export system ATPase subunit
MKILILFSTFIFIFLLLIYSLSYGQNLSYLKDNKFSKISFEIECGNKNNNNKEIFCKPSHNNFDDKSYYNSKILSPTDILFNIIDNKPNTIRDIKTIKEISNLLSNVIMNGVPLFSIDDYVYLSDLINKNIGEKNRNNMITNVYHDSFTNILDIRIKEIKLAPRNCYTILFLEYLYKSSKIAKKLNIKIYNTIDDAYKDSFDNIFAIIEIIPIKNNNKNNEYLNDLIDSNSCNIKYNSEIFIKPKVTIKMHPSSIPDTRNYKWSPLKGRSISKLQSGQLLYFISGFLTFQLELQNYFSIYGLGGSVIKSDFFSNGGAELFNLPNKISNNIAADYISSNTPFDLYNTIIKSSRNNQPSIKVPIYHRSLNLHSYKQKVYWHSYSIVITSILILYFAIPGTVIAGLFWSEVSCGHIDVLSTLPGIKVWHSAFAWILTSLIWLFISFIFCWSYFCIIFVNTSSLLPSLNLLLCGLALVSLSMILGILIRKPSNLVIAIPTLVFVTMLPGLLYFDLAFDTQRSTNIELIISLFPPSAIALIIRQICGLQALSISATWTYITPLTETPVYWITIVLIFDCILYSFLAIWLINYFLTPLQNSYNIDNNKENNSNIGKFNYNSVNNKHDHSLISTISIKSLHKEYNLGNISVPVISDFTTDLYHGCITILLGSNGSGKTSLMKILARLDNSFSGSINLNISINRAISSEFVNKRRIGWCPQNEALYEYMTVQEHIELFYSLLQLKEEIESKDYIITTLYNLDMYEHRNKLIRELSGGMKRRLSLALAFCGSPDILILDEPTSGNIINQLYY